MRLFIGVYLAGEMLEEVNHFIQLSNQNLGLARHGLKWTSPENLHFTLKFFGEVPASRVNDLTQALRQATSQCESFSLQLGKPGRFPAKGLPKIIWIGVTTGESQLVKAATFIENACVGCGFPKEERPFSPHLTIARVKGDMADTKFLEPQFQFTSTTVVQEISLIESQLYRTGPVYRQVENFRLRPKKL